MNYLDVLRAQLDAMSVAIVAALPSLAIAAAVLVVTWIVARFAVRLGHRVVAGAHFRENLVELLETLIRLLVWIAGIFIALAIVVPGVTPGGLVAGLGIGAVAIGFAFQDIFENFLAGVLIMLRDKMRIGDMVEVEGLLGKVERVTLRETHVRHYSGELTILPNSMIFKNAVKIYTDQAQRRSDLVIGVSYDTDLPKAEAAIRQAVEGIPHLAEGRPVDVYATEFNSSSIDFLVRWWTDTVENDIFKVKADVVFAIKQALDEAEIEIPFPYLTHTFKEPLTVAAPTE